MAQFSESKKGYNKEEVDSYINKMLLHSDKVLSEHKNKITALTEENNKLKLHIVKMKDMEGSVNKALISACEKARLIDEQILKKIKLENDRLKLFKEKWINYCNSVINDAHIDKYRYGAFNFLSLAEEELTLVINKYFKLSGSSVTSDMEKQYIEENARLLKKNYKYDWADNIIKECYDDDKKDDNSFAASMQNDFSTSESLEKLCNDLGLIN